MGPLQILAATLLASAAGKQCYDCGYQVDNWNTGSNVQVHHPLPEINQCGDTVTMESNVVECASGDDCCGSVKEFYIYPDGQEVDGRPGHIDMVARHACEKTLADSFTFDVICNDHTESCFNYTYVDVPEHHSSYATACFCEGDKCNNQVPPMPAPTTEKPTTTSCPECRQCYSCGYRKAGEDGEASKLPELAFCSDFSTPTDIVATCGLGDCCGSLKEYIIKVNETSGQNSTEIIGRHGCVSDMDHLSQYSATCKDNGESCFQVDDASLPHDGESTIVQAEICMCNRDRCNNDDPIPEVPTTTMAPGSADRMAMASGLVLVMGVLSLY